MKEGGGVVGAKKKKEMWETPFFIPHSFNFFKVGNKMLSNDFFHFTLVRCGKQDVVQ